MVDYRELIKLHIKTESLKKKLDIDKKPKSSSNIAHTKNWKGTSCAQV